MKNGEQGSPNESLLKPKKVTAYAEAVRGSYKTLRNITTNIYEGSDYAKQTWLGTRDSERSYDEWTIRPSGSLNYHGYNTYNAFGIRPAIEY